MLVEPVDIQLLLDVQVVCKKGSVLFEIMLVQ
jgi:hypothetical protein